MFLCGSAKPGALIRGGPWFLSVHCQRRHGCSGLFLIAESKLGRVPFAKHSLPKIELRHVDFWVKDGGDMITVT